MGNNFNSLSLSDINVLLGQCKIFFPDFFGQESSEEKIDQNKLSVFSENLRKITGLKKNEDIGVAISRLSKRREQLEISPTTIEKGQLENLEEQAEQAIEKKEAERKSTDAKKEQTEKLRSRIPKSQPQSEVEPEQTSRQKSRVGEVLGTEPPKPTIDNQETLIYAVVAKTEDPIKLASPQAKKLKEMRALAVSKPQQFIDDFVAEATKVENLPPGIHPEAVKMIAAETALQVVSDLSRLDVNALSKGVVPNPNKLFAQIAVTSQLQGGAGNKFTQLNAYSGLVESVARKATTSVLGPEVTTFIFGPSEQKFKISTQKPMETKEFVVFDMQKIQEAVSSMSFLSTKIPSPQISQASWHQQVESFAENLPTPSFSGLPRAISSIIDLFKSVPTSSLSNPLITDSLAYQQWATKFMPESLNFLFKEQFLGQVQLGPTLIKLGFSPMGGLSFGATSVTTATSAATETAGVAAEAAGAAAEGAAAVAGEVAVVEGTAAAAAPATGGLSLLIGAVLLLGKKIIDKIIELFPGIKKFFEENKELLGGFGIASVAVGLLSGSLLLIGGGGFATGIALASGATFASSLAGLSLLSSLIFVSIFKNLVKPLLIVLIGLPILVALILFIINSGAYVVPPTTGGTNVPGAPLTGEAAKCIVWNETKGSYLENVSEGPVTSLGWQDYPDKQQKIITAINYLSRSASWVNYFCSSGNVTLTHAAQVAGFGGWTATPQDIVFYSIVGLGVSQDLVTYTFAHESGHVIQDNNSSVYTTYRQLAAPDGGWLPSYIFAQSDTEDLAETIAVYPVYKGYPITDAHSALISGELDDPKWKGHKEFGKFIYQVEF